MISTKKTNIKLYERLRTKLNQLESGIRWKLQPVGIQNRFRLGKFFNIHRGLTCFIIGNGPSLNNMNLRLLRDQYTFGLNRIYLLFPKLGFSTSYFVSVNKLVLEQYAKEIQLLQMPKFISWYGREYLAYSSDIYYVRDPYDGTFSFSKDPRSKIWEGSTVTYVALQLAYYMGFQKVILIGIDHNFQTKGKAHKIVETKELDRNHFDPNYFGKGFRWQLPDLLTSEKAYKIAKNIFEEDGREILDATVNGKLEIFNKIRYLSAFK